MVMKIDLREAELLVKSNSDWKHGWNILDDNDVRVLYIRTSPDQLLWIGFDGRCFISK